LYIAVSVRWQWFESELSQDHTALMNPRHLWLEPDMLSER
jgi:hypothetical protein